MCGRGAALTTRGGGGLKWMLRGYWLLGVERRGLDLSYFIMRNSLGLSTLVGT